MITKRFLMSVLLATVVGHAAVSSEAAAQTYPTRMVKIVVPFLPGATSDAIARLLADKLSGTFGQTVIVENRPGGPGGSIGTSSVAAANPDGYTLLLLPVDALTTAWRLVNKALDLDPAKNFAPVALLSTSPFVINVNQALPVKTLADFAVAAKVNPGKFSFGSPGYGTYPHLLAAMFALSAGAEMVHVPYRGGPPIVNDLLAGQLQLFVIDPGLVRPHIEAGKLNALAVTSETRSPYLPGVPTTIESGFPKLRADYALGLFAPVGTPMSVIDRLNWAVNEAMTSAAVREGLSILGAKANAGTAQDFAVYFADVAKTSADMMAAVGIKVE
jgi:tripartite-type tricarboxylate transporter receptor subunit TctC